MREFFRGWRRKAGCATLVMAIGMTGLWIRTLFFADQLVFSIGDRRHYIASARNGISWLSLDLATPTNWDTVSTDVLTQMHGNKSLAQILNETIAEHTEADRHPVVAYVLYWWLTLPLTLLSAYLIVWKPRKRNSGPAKIQGSANLQNAPSCLT